MYTINSFFEHVFYPNLNRRPDRREAIESQLTSLGIKAERIIAIDGQELDFDPFVNEKSVDRRPISKGDIGCTLTHLAMCEIAKERGYKNYMVFEDDAEFDNDFLSLFDTCISQLPDDWDMVYLGGSIIVQPTMVTKNIGRCRRTYTSHAVAFRETIYDDLIQGWGAKDERIDLVLWSLQKDKNCYMTLPKMVYQADGYSDIMEMEVEYKHLRNC